MKTLQPKIRFPEFDGNWEEKKLGEIGKFSKGKGISKADIVEDGKFECIRYGQLYTHYGETIKEIISTTNIEENNLIFSEFNDIIIPASGETQLDIATASCVLKDKVALGGDLNIIKTNENGVFLSYYLNNTKKEDIASLAQGVSVVHLYSSQLSTLNLNIPSLQEQTKIANFLTAIDEKINLLKEKATTLEEYKKGIMQKIFNQDIRFKDDIGNDFKDWEEIIISELTDVIVGGTPSTTKEEYWNGNIAWLSSGELNNRIVSESKKFITEIGLKNSSAKIMKTNTVLLAMTGATLGKMGFLTFDSTGNQSIAGFQPNGKFNSKFLFYTLLFNKNTILSMAGGAAQQGINKASIEGLVFNFCCLEEQTKIANFLSSIDEKIELIKTQLQETQEYKKGLLQKMFV